MAVEAVEAHSVTQLAHLDMINPLEAMIAARAANQNSYSQGVQNVGAVDPRVLLAAQQMNTPTIGARIDAGNGQMVAVDPYKYANAKQQRDYAAAMNARTNNTNMQVANANNLNKQFLDNQLHERNLARDNTAFERGQTLAQTGHSNKMAQIAQDAQLNNANNLAAEAREMEALEQKQKILLTGQENLMKLKNSQYGDELRGMLGNSIQTQMQWVGGQKDVTQKTYMEEAYYRKALELNQDPAIQTEYVRQQNLKGIVKPPPLKRTDGNGKINPLYQQIANDLLMQDPNLPSIQQKINSEVGNRMRNTETMINQQAMAAQQLITKTGVSPSIDPNFTANFGGQALQPNLQLSGPPVPPVPTISTEETTEGGNSPYMTLNAGKLIADIASDTAQSVMNNSSDIVAGGTGLLALDQVTKQSKGTVDDLIKDADIPKGSINNRKPIDEVPLNDTEKSKISAFKKVAKSTGAKVPDDIDILKMSSGDIKSHITEGRKGIITRMIKRVGVGSKAGKYLKTVLKSGKYLAPVGAWLFVKDLETAVTPEQKESLKAGDELIEAQNAGSNSGTINGVGWSRK